MIVPLFSSVQHYLPAVTPVIGLTLLVAGRWMLSGREPHPAAAQTWSRGADGPARLNARLQGRVQGVLASWVDRLGPMPLLVLLAMLLAGQRC